MENPSAEINDPGFFRNLGLETIKELETDQGILASSRTEAYGCIFGRDSLITSLKLLRLDRRERAKNFFPLVRKVLLNLCQLQGRRHNLESGEQPGKCIHEFRPQGHEHLTMLLNPPWYVYDDQVMRNYDTVDATPLFLITLYRYWQYSADAEFLAQVMPNVDAALQWMIQYADSNYDGLIDYQFSAERHHGGLFTQNWMDSTESVFHETEGILVYPLAPVEVQAYGYMAYRLWADYFAKSDFARAADLNSRADKLKKLFNEKYPALDPAGNWYLAWKLDAEGRQFRSVRSNMGHCLWASLNERDDGRLDTVVDEQYISAIVARLLKSDMFEPDAGIRTLSAYSVKYDPNSYHNGSIWPHDNAMIAEGFENHGFHKEAALVRRAILNAIAYFKTPIELYVYNGRFLEWVSPSGQRACKKQAWSAASILDLTA